MAGILDNIMAGYANRVLGAQPQDTSAQTADAYSRLQQAIAGDYAKQKQMFEQDPANKGKQWQMPGAQERFQDQVHAMVLSGDPSLQQRGLQLLTAPQEVKDERTAFQKDYEFLKMENPNLTREQAYRIIHPGRAVTNVNVSTGGDLSRVNFLTPDEKQALNLPQGTAFYVNKSGEIKEAPGSRDIATQQQSLVTQASMDETNSLLFGKDGIYSKTKQAVKDLGVPASLQRPGEAAYSAAQVYLQEDPMHAQYSAIKENLASTIGRAYLGEKGVMTDYDTQRIGRLLPDPRFDTEETAKAKYRYIKRIMNESDPTKVKQMVYSGGPESTTKPGAYTSSSGIKFTVE